MGMYAQGMEEFPSIEAHWNRQGQPQFPGLRHMHRAQV